MGSLVPGPSDARTQRASLRTCLSGQRAQPPLSGGVAWPGTGILGFFCTFKPRYHPLGGFSGWGNVGADVRHPLSCPALPPSPGMGAQPALVIVCSGACLQPPFSPAPPLACKVCFLIAAPTTHLGSARSPSSSSLPPSSGVGPRGKANLTAAPLS